MRAKPRNTSGLMELSAALKLLRNTSRNIVRYITRIW